MAKRKNNIDDIDIVDDFELEDIDDFDPFDVLDDSYEDKKSYGNDKHAIVLERMILLLILPSRQRDSQEQNQDILQELKVADAYALHLRL